MPRPNILFIMGCFILTFLEIRALNISNRWKTLSSDISGKPLKEYEKIV